MGIRHLQERHPRCKTVSEVRREVVGVLPDGPAPVQRGAAVLDPLLQEQIGLPADAPVGPEEDRGFTDHFGFDRAVHADGERQGKRRVGQLVELAAHGLAPFARGSGTHGRWYFTSSSFWILRQ